MSLKILQSGMQSTLQGAPRKNFRHQGVPASGPADDHSALLANIAVGNKLDETVIEITAGGFEAKFEKATEFALTGAPCPTSLDETTIPYYKSHHTDAGSAIKLDVPKLGLRTYLAISGGFKAEKFLDSTSTYLPANLGGHEGMQLKPNDTIEFLNNKPTTPPICIPPRLHPFFSNLWPLRVCKGPEFSALSSKNQKSIFRENLKIGSRLNRMGIQLDNVSLEINSDGRMKSEPVFPGTIQCPEDGNPFILLTDAQTTGGYPRILQVISADRHRLGQIRPHDGISFILTKPDEAVEILKQKKNAINQLTQP